MLLKKIVGSFLIVLNLCGLGFVLYCIFLKIKDSLLSKKSIDEPITTKPVREKNSVIINDDIIPDEDDLLKDMDLSDLDDLNLDDFE